MIEIGTVTGYIIAKNRDGDSDVLLLQCEMSEDTDIQTVEYIQQPGEDGNPAMGSSVIIFDIGKSYRFAIACDDNIVPEMLPGERKLYSVSGGEVSAFANFLSTGIIELNGNTESAVKFKSLDMSLQTMVVSINAELAKIATVLNSLVPGSYTPTPITLDMSAAEVPEVVLP